MNLLLEDTGGSQHSNNQPITFAQGDQYLMNNSAEEELADSASSIGRSWSSAQTRLTKIQGAI